MTVNAPKTLKPWPSPPVVSIPLGGARVVKEIKKGRQVALGEVVARHPSPVKGDRHASIGGTVVDLGEDRIIIEAGDGVMGRHPQPVRWQDLPPSDYRGAVKALGVDIFEPPRAEEPLVVNALSPDVGITHPQALWAEQGGTILDGLDLAVQLLPQEKKRCRVVWVLPPETATLRPDDGTVFLADRYPSGLPPLVKKSVTGYLDSDAAGVLDLRYLYLLGRLKRTGLPLTEVPATINGASYLVPLGLRLGDIAAGANLMLEAGRCLVLNGLMRGRATVCLERGLGPGDWAVSAAPSPPGMAVVEEPCLYCRRCAQACPLGLPIDTLSLSWPVTPSQAGFGKVKDNFMTCLECGLCRLACPAGRGLSAMLAQLRGKAHE